MKANTQLIDLCDRIRSDPSNAGYLFLLGNYTNEQIKAALDELDKPVTLTESA